jgi:hypothetical protein
VLGQKTRKTVYAEMHHLETLPTYSASYFRFLQVH